MAFNFPQELVLIDTLTASNSATISFTTGISSNFADYVVKIRNMIPVSNATTLQMLWSTDGGSSYLATNYEGVVYQSNTSTITIAASATTSITLANAVSSTAGNLVNGEVDLYDLSNSLTKNYYSFLTHVSSAAAFSMKTCAGRHSGTTAVNAVRFQMSSGNISSGVFKLYGVPYP